MLRLGTKNVIKNLLLKQKIPTSGNSLQEQQVT